jgi:uncharacterized protein YgbK (DUF1537 family)
MQHIRLIADDLTGALDSACAFASRELPVVIGLPWKILPDATRMAISTESRDWSEDDAIGQVTAAVDGFGSAVSPDALWFKKIDSVMRGHPVAETKAVMDAGGFDHCVFAPAFPEMGRITVAGQQFVIAADGVSRPVGPNLLRAFRSMNVVTDAIAFDYNGAPLASVARWPTCLIIEAESQQQLAMRAAAVAKSLSGFKVLWAGAGGLAAAIGDVHTVSDIPRVGFFVVGTNHPATMEQASLLLRSGLVQQLDEYGTSRQAPLLVAPSLWAGDALETTRKVRADVERIDIEEPAHTTVVVTGGDTLSTVLRTVDADYLECTGEARTGIPVSRICGGRWHGVTLLSKSGGFGAPDLFVHLVEASSDS